MNSDMSVISIKDLHKVYDETKVPVHALNGIDLTISEAEFTAIVGPSGSGKTTLLNMIGGLDTPTQGEVNINGTNVNTLRSGRLIDFRLHHIGFVFQAYNLIPVLTALENVAFIMQLQGVPRKQRHGRAMELLEAVGIADKAGGYVADLNVTEDAWPWHGRWRRSRASSSPTSPRPTSTPAPPASCST